MSGGKGGGGGAGAMLQYGDKALDLQRQQYEDNKQLIQPYYNAGTSGLNELMRRLGLGGGMGTQGVKTEAQLRQELMPSYTTSTRTGASPVSSYNDNGYQDERFSNGLRVVTNPDGTKNVIDLNSGGGFRVDKNGSPILANSATGSTQEASNINRALSLYGTLGSQSSSVDNEGLNTAVQKALADQNAAQAGTANDPLYGSLLKSFSMEDYQADPGYKFRLSEGNKALERAMASQGKFASMNPEALKALQAYGQDMASQEYGNAYNRYNIDQDSIFNRLASIAGIGQTASGQLTGIGQNYANAGTELYTGMGNAITAAQQAKAANRGSMFNSIAGLGLNLALAPTTGGGSLFSSLLGR